MSATGAWLDVGPGKTSVRRRVCEPQTGEGTTCAPGALSSAPSAMDSDNIRTNGAKGDPTMGSTGRMPSGILAGSKMSTGGEK